MNWDMIIYYTKEWPCVVWETTIEKNDGGM